MSHLDEDSDIEASRAPLLDHLVELRKEVEALRHASPMQAAADAAGHAEVQATFDEIHAGLSEAGMQPHPAMAFPLPTEVQPAAAEKAARPQIVEPPVVEAATKPARKPRARKPSARKAKTDEIVR